MKRTAAIAIAIIALITLTACGGPDHGTVRGKSYSPETIVMQCMAQPKGGCIMYPQVYPASWSLDIYNGDEHGWKRVTEETYDAYKVGDYIDFREDR